MAAAPGHKLGKDGKKDSDRQPDANLGNHGLRARQSKVDYCELKNKPHQLYRTAVIMPKDKPLKLPKKAEEDVPVQLPGKVEPWPVWIKHSAKASAHCTSHRSKNRHAKSRASICPISSI